MGRVNSGSPRPWWRPPAQGTQRLHRQRCPGPLPTATRPWLSPARLQQPTPPSRAHLPSAAGTTTPGPCLACPNLPAVTASQGTPPVLSSALTALLGQALHAFTVPTPPPVPAVPLGLSLHSSHSPPPLPLLPSPVLPLLLPPTSLLQALAPTCSPWCCWMRQVISCCSCACSFLTKKSSSHHSARLSAPAASGRRWPR